MLDVEADLRLDRVRAMFWLELETRLPGLNRALLRLERASNDPTGRASALGELFREAHNLKAAARAVDHVGIEQASSALETRVAEARRPGGEAPEGVWFDAAYALVDQLAAFRSASGQSDEELDVEGDNDDPVVVDQPTPPVAADTSVAPLHAIASDSVRVAVDKLDVLLTQSGELTVSHLRVHQRQLDLRAVRDELELWQRDWRNTRRLRTALRRTDRPGSKLDMLVHLVDQAEQRSLKLLQSVDTLSAQLAQDIGQLGAVTRALEEEVMGVRLLPVASVCTVLERALRDLTRSTGKEAQLIVQGGETEIDRKILEQVRDPLMHMLRNAVDHGIELPAARVAAGKPRAGTARLSAALRGGYVEIEVSDDGAGLDVGALRASAVRKGLLTSEQATATDDASIMDIIFQPGFSTRTAVTDLSGRGVGLDVVRQYVEQLNGHVHVTSQPGLGTRFTLRVPLTLATTRAILLEDGGQAYALPSALVQRSARVRQQDILHFEGRRAVAIEGRPVPVIELATILERVAEVDHKPMDWRSLLVLQLGDRRLALLTDTLIGEREIVVKTPGWPLSHVPNVSGAAVLRSGETVVILNSSDLLKNGLRVASAAQQSVGAGGGGAGGAPDHRVRRILTVDDSLTTRTLMRSILEAAGYVVVVASDGLEALAVLHRETIDLVVSDVEMPHMDGYDLTEAIRRDEALRQVPVILVTSLGDSDHRERGVAVGADAYIVKLGFVQGQLLDTVSRLL